MNIIQKLLVVALLVFITASLTSCFVRRSPDRNWVKKPNRAYYYKQNGGRKLWVRDRFMNTR